MAAAILAAALAVPLVSASSVTASATPKPAPVYTTHGYQLRNPSTGAHLCLEEFYEIYGDRSDAPTVWVVSPTSSCNYNDPAQQWTARVDGNYGKIDDNKYGHCLGLLSSRNTTVGAMDCPYAGSWRRTGAPNYQWVAGSSCLTGRLTSTSDGPPLYLAPCNGSFLQRWYATG